MGDRLLFSALVISMGLIFLRLSHMLYVVFLGDAVVAVLVFPGCFHFYFVLL